MIRLAADEDFNGIILRGLRRRFPALDLVRAHTVGLGGALDDVILEWAARDERLLWLAIGLAIEEIGLVVECSEQEDEVA